MLTQFGLYLEMEEPSIGYAECAKAAANEGVYIIQLNMDKAPNEKIVSTAREVKEAIEGTDTRLIINCDIESAIKAGVDGVYLNHGGAEIEKARKMWTSPEGIFGISSNGHVRELASPEIDPDYVIVGPVFISSNLKIQPIGLERLEELAGETPIPLVASGGITIANVRDVLDTGAMNYLISKAITSSPDPEKEIRKFKKIEEEYLSW